VWDYRQPVNSVATIGGIHATRGHSQMVTCLDAVNHSLISAGLDHQILIWDIRKLGAARGEVAQSARIPLDQHAILKISAIHKTGADDATALVAVSSVKGLFVVRVSDGKVVKAEPPQDKQEQDFKAYHDLLWTASGLVERTRRWTFSRSCRSEAASGRATLHYSQTTNATWPT